MARESSRRSPTELLTAHFYNWELRGRGWQLYDAPVLLEPPYRPFHRNGVLQHAERPRDDGRLETFGSGIVSFLKGIVGLDSQPSAATYSGPEEPLATYDEDAGAARNTLRIVLPENTDISREAAEQMVVSLSTCLSPVSFEIIGTAGAVSLQVTCATTEAATVHQAIAAYFPEAIIEEREDALVQAWEDGGGSQGLVVDLGLSNEFMRPVRTFRRFDVDPLIAIVAGLSDVRSGEVAALQVLFQSCRHSWTPCILRAVSDGTGHAFFADAPEMLPLSKEKTSRPLCAVVVRAAAKCESGQREADLVRGLMHALTQLAEPSSNEFIPLTNDEYDDDDHKADLLTRASRRGGMILNTAELVSLVHLPSASVRLPKLDRERRKTKAAPLTLVGHQFVLGENQHAGRTVTVSLSEEQRSRHVYVIGASGTGKSTLLLNMIAQDVRNGRGIGVLDPHGDLIDAVLGHIPPERYDDVVLFDPSDEEYPVGFNILSAHSELEKTLLASDLAGIFRRFSTSFGDQMQAVLSNAILAILENERGGTLLDLRRFLTEKPFRAEYLKTVTDSEVVYYFEREFPLLKGTPQASILTRLNMFLRPKPIRYMVAQKQGLDFAGIMNRGKIFLAKLSHGLIGEENSYLLGALLVTKFHQLAMGRQDTAAAERRPFSLYVDEFHNFATPSMTSVLSGARKYRLELVLAHQELAQLTEQDSRVASAALTNPGTRICFRVGDQDAKKLAEGFASFDGRDLQSLGVGQAICRVERAEYDFPLTTIIPPAIEASIAEARRAAIVERSRAKWGRARAEVDGPLAAQRSEPLAPEPTPVLERTPEPGRVVTSTPIPAVATEPATPRKPMRVAEPSAPLLGRGGREHKYLQHLVKRLAEDRGFRAVIEEPILAGAGSIDVSLMKGERRIAVEISVSSDADHEVNNLQKTMAGGFDVAVCLAADPKVLRRIRERVEESLEAASQSRIRFLQPEDLVTFLDEVSANEASDGESVVRGYRVKRGYKAISPAEAASRKQAIARLLGGHARSRGERA